MLFCSNDLLMIYPIRKYFLTSCKFLTSRRVIETKMDLEEFEDKYDPRL